MHTFSIPQELPANRKEGATLKEIRKFLSDRLTNFMVPEFFVKVKEIPLTRRGKVDVGALPVDRTHVAFVAVYKGDDCGCGGICYSDELPSPDNPSGKCAYLMNIYVREAFRKHGIAHKIVSRLIEEAKTHGCGKIYLETTADGKPVYASLGFRDMADMMKYYDTEN
ncbi:MAG: GNAT family N-acetyltransferase [Muribaculaceae bacterium]|nr:GNAT family N-acetyltransferase [Muribaculaceae bacterium]